MGRRGRGVRVVGGRRKLRCIQAKYSTCVPNADAQYFKDKLRGGWEQNRFFVMLSRSC